MRKPSNSVSIKNSVGGRNEIEMRSFNGDDSFEGGVACFGKRERRNPNHDRSLFKQFFSVKMINFR